MTSLPSSNKAIFLLWVAISCRLRRSTLRMRNFRRSLVTIIMIGGMEIHQIGILRCKRFRLMILGLSQISIINLTIRVTSRLIVIIRNSIIITRKIMEMWTSMLKQTITTCTNRYQWRTSLMRIQGIDLTIQIDSSMRITTTKTWIITINLC